MNGDNTVNILRVKLGIFLFCCVLSLFVGIGDLGEPFINKLNLFIAGVLFVGVVETGLKMIP